MILSCSLLIARERVGAAKNLLKLYKELSDAAEEASALIRFQSMDVYQLCESVFEKRKSILPSFGGIRDNFTEMWVKACKQDILPLSVDACELFESAGSFLGQYDAQSQLERLSYINSELTAWRKLSAEELAKKKKLYYSVSGFAGAMVCLFFL